jgi:gas vesicle protein GvpA/GvpJ/GvpM family
VIQREQPSGSMPRPPANGNGQLANGQIARSDSLIDVLDRVLDKGVVIAGDIKINLLDIELLTIKIRLLIASVDKAREMGIDWWAHDPQLSAAKQRQDQKLEDDREKRQLRQRIAELESRVKVLAGPRQGRSS